jgi:hypothetical protein
VKKYLESKLKLELQTFSCEWHGHLARDSRPIFYQERLDHGQDARATFNPRDFF